MKKFVVLYYAPISAQEQMAKASKEEMAKGMEAWMEWAKKCGDSLVDLGTPLGGEQRMSGSESTCKNSVCGYSILQAEDMDGAKKLLEGHPHMGWTEGCEIKVFESMPLPE